MGDPLKEAREEMREWAADLAALNERVGTRDEEHPAVAKSFQLARIGFKKACEKYVDACGSSRHQDFGEQMISTTTTTSPLEAEELIDFDRLQIQLGDAEDKVKNLEQEVAKARESIKYLVGILRKIQWAGTPSKNPRHYMEGSCPSCRAAESAGHAEKCELALEIAD